MKLGVIGTGKMGSALLRGMLESGILTPEQVCVFNHTPANVTLLTDSYPALTVCRSAREVTRLAETVLLAIKPYGILSMLKDLTHAENADSRLYISVAAGITLDAMEKVSAPGTRIIRTMPNTPSLIGQGMIAYAPGSSLLEHDEETLIRLLAPSGLVERVAESQIDTISAIAGSGPAYMFVIIDALCEAGVALGLKRDAARRYAVQMMLGSALLAKQSSEHLMQLRDDVTSPGGSTIAALNVLDETGLRHALIKAVKAAHARTREMGE